MQEKITPIQYAAAVAALLNVAKNSTSGGRVAAQVLLSAYNGFAFQLDVAEMQLLDRQNFELAMIVIRGRYDCNLEPHHAVPGSDQAFSEMWDRWKSQHVEERGKTMCSVCWGAGKLYVNPDDENDIRTEPCQACKGKGRYWPP